MSKYTGNRFKMAEMEIMSPYFLALVARKEFIGNRVPLPTVQATTVLIKYNIDMHIFGRIK